MPKTDTDMSVTVREIEALGNFTIVVRFERNWRCQVGLWLIRLGARLAGIEIEVDIDGPDEDRPG